MTPINSDRAKWAKAAVQTFADVTGLDTASELETAIADLLADLAHLCDAEGLSLFSLLESATRHYAAECDDEGSPAAQL